jgi:hypothetical protein
VFLATKVLPRNFSSAIWLQQKKEAFGDLAQIISISTNSIGPISQFPSKNQ